MVEWGEDDLSRASHPHRCGIWSRIEHLSISFGETPLFIFLLTQKLLQGWLNDDIYRLEILIPNILSVCYQLTLDARQSPG